MCVYVFFFLNMIFMSFLFHRDCEIAGHSKWTKHMCIKGCSSIFNEYRDFCKVFMQSKDQMHDFDDYSNWM